MLPVTRFSVAEAALGWVNTTLLPWLTEKLVQLITARALVWATVVMVPAAFVVMLAVPCATMPPTGSVPAWAAPAMLPARMLEASSTRRIALAARGARLRWRLVWVRSMVVTPVVKGAGRASD